MIEVFAACHAENGNFGDAIEWQSKAATLVEQNKTPDPYTEDQRIGMQERLLLYKRKMPYRTAELTQIPIRSIQNLLQDSVSLK